MADAENAFPASKKRIAGRQISKDDPSLDDETPESEMGTFQRASDEVLATRRIVKVKRHQQPSASSLNPFVAIRLVTPAEPDAKPAGATVQPESIDAKSGDGKGTEGEKLANEAIGAGENEKKFDGVTDSKASEGDDKLKCDAVDEAEQAVASDENVESGEKTDSASEAKPADEGGKETEKGARDKGDGGKTQKGKLDPKKEGVEKSKKPLVAETSKEDRGETGKEKLEIKHTEKSEPVGYLSSFKQLSGSQNAFTGLAGTGFSSSSFSFATIAKEGSAFAGSCGSLFGFKSENSSGTSLGSGTIGNNNNVASSFQLFGSTATDASKSGTIGITSMQALPIETGEEKEKAVFTADAILYEYLDGGWKERGKGELKVNVSTSGPEKARLIMRARGNYRLILNANLYPDMSPTNMDKKGITFACMNSVGDAKDGLATFALKFKDSSLVEEFSRVVTTHKGKKVDILKTPENSIKAADR